VVGVRTAFLAMGGLAILDIGFFVKKIDRLKLLALGASLVGCHDIFSLCVKIEIHWVHKRRKL